MEGLGPLSINNDVRSESEPGLELVGGRKRGDSAADEAKEPGAIEAQRPAKHPRIFGASVKAVHDAILSKRLFTALVFLPLPGIPEKLSGEDARVYVQFLLDTSLARLQVFSHTLQISQPLQRIPCV